MQYQVIFYYVLSFFRSENEIVFFNTSDKKILIYYDVIFIIVNDFAGKNAVYFFLFI